MDDGSAGMRRTVHPNIGVSGSAAGMVERGYWGASDRTPASSTTPATAPSTRTGTVKQPPSTAAGAGTDGRRLPSAPTDAATTTTTTTERTTTVPCVTTYTLSEFGGCTVHGREVSPEEAAVAFEAAIAAAEREFVVTRVPFSDEIGTGFQVGNGDMPRYCRIQLDRY